MAVPSVGWAQRMADLSVFYALGFALVIVGIIVIVAVIAKTATGSREGESRMRGAGVIMIGPIPIIFGTDKKSVKEILVLALALVIVALIAILVYYWLWR
jgi:uncharacterized protein (TIGR00304 family)